MNRLETWKKQGEYKSFNTGEKMILVKDDKTGATVLEPVYKKYIYHVIFVSTGALIAKYKTIEEAEQHKNSINKFQGYEMAKVITYE